MKLSMLFFNLPQEGLLSSVDSYALNLYISCESISFLSLLYISVYLNYISEYMLIIYSEYVLVLKPKK